MKKFDADKIYVFIGDVEKFKDNTILPSYTKNELMTITDEKVKSEKRAGYGLMLFVLKKYFGIVEDFKKLEKINGKPISPDYNFSNSHSNGLVALAISTTPVGMDLEILKDRKFDTLTRHIMHKNEHFKLNDSTSILKLWTKKEACFKLAGDSVFRPENIDTTAFSTTTKQFSTKDSAFILSVASHYHKSVIIKFV